MPPAICGVINSKALATATTTKKRRVGWFENDKDHMQPLIEKKAELLHRTRSPNPQDDLEIETIQSNLKNASKEVKDRTEIAKSIWAKKLGEKVNHVNVTPKQAWEAAYEIKDGVKGHHTHPIAMKFKKANGSLAANPQENAGLHWGRLVFVDGEQSILAGGGMGPVVDALNSILLTNWHMLPTCFDFSSISLQCILRGSWCL
jgi:hypothetical protein